MSNTEVEAVESICTKFPEKIKEIKKYNKTRKKLMGYLFGQAKKEIGSPNTTLLQELLENRFREEADKIYTEQDKYR